VWEYLGRIASHVEWMADAEAIRFQTAQREGVGTAFETDTKVGPFRLKDQMVITEWEPGRVMGIRHTGVVTGTGRFTLEEIPDVPSGTRFTWEEDLHFPPWLGGAVGGRAGAPVLKWIWQRNLDNLRLHFAAPGG
jgi:Polyketide cyclase / dehydrase and lipid transport